MPKKSCTNCGHDVSIGVNPKRYVAGVYHFREKGVILRTKNYSQRCFDAKCGCVSPKIGSD